jgi:L-rhamnonate dehydratase
MSRIAAVEVIPIMTATVDAEDLDGSSDTVVVRIVDEDGRAGIGEADAPAELVKGFVEMQTLHLWSRRMIDMLVGEDPFEIGALHERLYKGTIYPGRRGLGIHALSAVDIALHDLVGKQLGRAAYQLLGGRCRERLTPYATIYPGMPRGRSLRELVDDIAGRIERALDVGFRAVKAEVLFYDLVSDRELVSVIRDIRRRLGDETPLLIDFGYRWHDWRAALWTLERIQDCDIYLAEATLQHDDLTGHARLAERVETRVGGAEFAATRFECREWLETGRVDVLQPDINRVGGLTEVRRVAELARHASAQVIPHGWKTGITAAAGLHFHAATSNSPYFEYLSPKLWTSPLRRELVSPEPELVDGEIALPTAPGLGIELNEEFVARHRTDRKGP